MRSENLSSRKGSLFGLSNMWMNTLYRRDLVLAFVASMAYFSVNILPLILSFSDFGSVKSYYVSVMEGGFNMTPLVACSYPVVLSVILFDYLHSSASAAGMHSLPLTRGKLFRSTFVSGTVLLLLPVLLTAVLMFVMGIIMPACTAETRIIYPGDTLSAQNCLRWFIDTSVGTLFVFAVSNLAGIVAGKNVIHALLACLLNSIAGIISVLVDMYARAFILGSDGAGLTELAWKSNPFLWYAAEREGLLSLKDLPMMLAFAGVTAALTVFAGLLYKKIRLEREQDATVFPVVSDMLVIFCSFCVMSVFGIISAEIMPDEQATYPIMPFITGCLIGGIPAFIVFRMIADSSVRIFRMRTLVNFAAFVAVTCVIFAFTCFDITGQTDRIPAPSDVNKVTIQSMEPFTTTFTLSEDSSKEDVIALHKAVLSHKDKMTRNNYDVDDTMEVVLEYRLKNGTVMKRAYNIHAGTLDDVKKAADRLSSGDEYQDKIEVYVRKVILDTDSCSVYTAKGDINIDREDIRPLLMAYLKDVRTNGFDYYNRVENEADDSGCNFTENRTAVINTVSKSGYDYELDPSIQVYFGKKDRNVQKFLEKRGYDKKLEKSEKDYDTISEGE